MPFADQHATQGLTAHRATELLPRRAGGYRELFVAAWPVTERIFACRGIGIALATFVRGVVRCPLCPNGGPITPCLFSATLLAVRAGAITTVSRPLPPTTGCRFTVQTAIAAQGVRRTKRPFTALQQTDTKSRVPRNLLHPPRCSINLRLAHGELLLPGGQVSLRRSTSQRGVFLNYRTSFLLGAYSSSIITLRSSYPPSTHRGFRQPPRQNRPATNRH